MVETYSSQLLRFMIKLFLFVFYKTWSPWDNVTNFSLNILQKYNLIIFINTKQFIKVGSNQAHFFHFFLFFFTFSLFSFCFTFSLYHCPFVPLSLCPCFTFFTLFTFFLLFFPLFLSLFSLFPPHCFVLIIFTFSYFFF